MLTKAILIKAAKMLAKRSAANEHDESVFSCWCVDAVATKKAYGGASAGSGNVAVEYGYALYACGGDVGGSTFQRTIEKLEYFDDEPSARYRANLNRTLFLLLLAEALDDLD